jgi:glycosyltransferase involved in cell wall biosynthesis
MRIGLLTTSFPRHHGDVAGHFVLGFARALAARGHQLEVLAPEPAEPLAPPRWPGVHVRFIPYMRPRSAARTFYGAGVPDNLGRDPSAWLGLAPFTAALLRAALQRRACWDALVSHWALPCGLIAGLVRQDRPHLAVLHSADLHVLSRLPLRSQVAQQIARGADRLLLVSERERQRFLEWLPASTRSSTRCHVQPMGFDAEADVDGDSELDPDRESLRRQLGLQGFTLLTIARLVPVKGLAEAVQSLLERADLTWLIAGDGPEAKRLSVLANGARLRVRLLGNVSGAHKRALLRAADAFVLPSRILPSGRSEGMPVALFEAMAQGLPTIASDVGGISEHVRHLETGLLLDPSAPDALERSVERLIAEPGLGARLGARARADVERHKWSAIAPELDAMLGGESRRARATRQTLRCA